MPGTLILLLYPIVGLIYFLILNNFNLNLLDIALANFLNIEYLSQNMFLIFIVGIFAIILLIILKATALLLINVDFTAIFKNVIFKIKNRIKEDNIEKTANENIEEYYEHDENLTDESSEDEAITIIEDLEPIKLDFTACLLVSLFSFSLVIFVLLACLGLGKIISGRII